MEKVFKKGEKRMRREFRLCGFGGQGIITAGIILGSAATVYAGLNAVQTQSYGPEARGGASKAEVVISDQEIGYPGVSTPDALLVMSQQAWDKYHHDADENTKIILDPDLVDPGDFEQRFKGKFYRARATRKASELGNRIVANIIMLGVLCEITRIVPEKSMEQAVLESVPKKYIELNKRAFQEGLKIGRDEIKRVGE